MRINPRSGARMADHDSRFTHHGFFVTGTDTGVGKTLVACALLHAFAGAGLACIGMKPVASGAEPRDGALVNDDAARLAAAASVAAAPREVNPYCFAEPIAPHIAAQRAGVRIELERIEAGLRALAARAAAVVVEGVGGFRVPLGEHADTADLAARLRLPVVLVVGLRLGCLNHALLTAEAIAARGLALAGWVANHIDPAMPAAEENVAALRARLGAPLIARVPFEQRPCARAVARLIDLPALTG